MELKKDSIDQDVITLAKFTGVRNDVTAERFDIGDMEIGENVTLDKSGQIARRDGYTLAQAGASHSVWANRRGDMCFFMQGDTLYQLNADMSKTQIGRLSNANRVAFEQVNDRTYLTNGADARVIEQGAVRSWGVAPPVLPQATLTVGAMPKGTYQFTATWVTNDGMESGAGMCATIENPADGGGIQFADIPAPPDPRIVAMQIYLSPFNGDMPFLALIVPVGQTSALYQNDTYELAMPLDSQFLQAAPAGQLTAFYRGHMFVAAGDVLYYSNAFDYERFDPRNYIQLDGYITMLAPIVDREMYDVNGKSSGFFVGTDREVGALVGTTPADFQFVSKARYGVVLGMMTMIDSSMFQDGGTTTREIPLFVTTQGICVGLPNLEVKNLTRSRMQFDVGNQGAALFQPGPNRFVATSRN